MLKILLVGFGGFLGAVARYLLGTYIINRLGMKFPYGTMAINLTGCFLVGFVVSFLTIRTNWSELWVYAIPIGFIGAYTTFSTFEFETLRAVQKGEFMVAALNVGLSLVLGFFAVWAGSRVGDAI